LLAIKQSKLRFMTKSPLPRAQRPGATVPRDLFLAWRFPRVGAGNPHELTNPVWQWLARTRLNAWQANAHFKGPSSLAVGPGWCADRFGQSTTTLTDGRVLAIGGEHEDHYDPDFCIYNDVHLTSPDGEVRILGYPTHVFPPTDFHSATLVGDEVVVIGGLGYAHERRPEVTPVFALNVNTLAFERRLARSEAGPGWLFEHSARLSKNQRAITVTGGRRLIAGGEICENFSDWSLNLPKLTWSCVEHRPWQEWVLEPSDAKHRSRLWKIGLLRWAADRTSEHDREQLAQWKKEFGALPDFALYDARYTPSVDHLKLPDEEGSTCLMRIDGVAVRYRENNRSVTVIIEGALPPRVVARLLGDAAKKLALLEGTAFRRRRLQ
jgi:hypothetical protein